MGELIETRRKDSERTTKEIYAHLNSLDKELRVDMDEKFEEVIKAIEKLKESIDVKNEKVDSRLKILENWRWILAGASAVILFIVNYAANFF